MKPPFDPIPFRGAYVDGRFRPSGRGRALWSEDPGDLDAPVGHFRSDPSWADAAVQAARRAQPAWRSLGPDKRALFLRRFQRRLLSEAERIALVISRETGKPLAESRAEVRAMAEKVDVTISDALPLVADRTFRLPDGTGASVRHRPVGVVAVIGPFNVPGHLPNGQIVPALLTGNTVVFKPSEFTPFTGQAMMECWDRAGLPPGVLNLVPGDGAVGARLAGHPGVNAIFFTGSAATGRRLAEASAKDPARLLALEMGGKNAALVLPDAPLETAVKEAVHGAFSTTGQRCSSTSRILLHRKAAGKFLDAFLAAVDQVTVGYFTEDSVMGPLINAAAAERFLKAQRTAGRQGFEALREGRRLDAARRGHYVGPSVHLREGLPPAGRPGYADEELFAPDVAVYVLKDEDEMLELHNRSAYGLAASVFTGRKGSFEVLRDRLEAGVIHWNRSTAMTPGRLPFGGVKASGNHRPAGLDVIRHLVVPVGSVENPGGKS